MEGKRCRILCGLCVGAIALAVLGVSRSACAGTHDIAHLRSTSAAIRELIDDATWESPTFRGLVSAIGATDGIVFVEEGICNHGVHACLVASVTPAGGYRILRILVDLQGALAHRSRLDLIATIGHELRHAVEVLADQTIRTAAAVFLFYVRQASTSNQTFETAAAIAAGIKIRHELGNHTTFVWQQVALDMAR